MFTGEEDLRRFFFLFQNVFVCDVDNDQNALELLAHLDGQALQIFFDRFTSDGNLLEKTKDFTVVKAVFIELFDQKKEPQEVIRRAIEAGLDAENLEKSVSGLNT